MDMLGLPGGGKLRPPLRALEPASRWRPAQGLIELGLLT